jgi:hypothetical protein
MPPSVRALRVISAAFYFWHCMQTAVMLYSSPLYWKQDYHMSALSGQAWVDELIMGHPERIKSELGMRVHVYLALVAQLRVLCGLNDSKHITLEEQVAITEDRTRGHIMGIARKRERTLRCVNESCRYGLRERIN